MTPDEKIAAKFSSTLMSAPRIRLADAPPAIAAQLFHPCGLEDDEVRDAKRRRPRFCET
jgi:hypothetical protein